MRGDPAAIAHLRLAVHHGMESGAGMSARIDIVSLHSMR